MKRNIIGRKNEIKRLQDYISSNKSEFVAIYGRRRVGKTFLVKELFENQFTFRMTGRENAKLQDQLANFAYAMNDFYGENIKVKNWTEAFYALAKAIERQPVGVKIIFIDELPWFDVQRSGFLSALEHFWNNWAFYRSDIKLIVCGSATSWMLNKVINARGGLHNRVTHRISVSPFTLKETELYFKSRGFVYERPEIISCYMAVGGVAYYLSLFENGKSVDENIENLCFTNGGELIDEFNKLYTSLFKKADSHLNIIRTLGTVGRGMSRLDIIEKTKLPNNGNLTTVLEELEQCEFIRSYCPFGKSKKDKMFQLIDQFSLFHLRFIGNKSVFPKNYWTKLLGTPEYYSWCGYAFETLCLHHIDQIVDGLGISGTINTPCSWIYRPNETERQSDDPDIRTGAQIDLLIDRNDKTITVCEMKYSENEYSIDKSYDQHVQARLRTFHKVTGTNKTLTTAYITPQGLFDNMYARRVGRQVTSEDLFE